MFEELIDEDDLETTEHRLRVHSMSLKKKGDVIGLFRLQGAIAVVLARRGNALAAMDSLNEAEYLVVEGRWRGTTNEVWFLHDKARVFMELGRPEVSAKELAKARELLANSPDPEAQAAVDSALSALERGR